MLEEHYLRHISPAGRLQQNYRNRFSPRLGSVLARPPLEPRSPRVGMDAVVTSPPGENPPTNTCRSGIPLWDRRPEATAKAVVTRCEKPADWANSSWQHRHSAGQHGVLVDPPEADLDSRWSAAQISPQCPWLPANGLASPQGLSSPGSGGYNELRIEDPQNWEQIAIPRPLSATGTKVSILEDPAYCLNATTPWGPDSYSGTSGQGITPCTEASSQTERAMATPDGRRQPA